MNTKQIAPFLGINNRLQDFDLKLRERGIDKGYFLRSADNVDVTDAGTLRRRVGTTLVQALTGAHSLFQNYFVMGGVLYRFSLPYAHEIVKVLASNNRMSYAVVAGEIYFSNGTDSGRIDKAGVVRPWGMPTPAEPTVSAYGGAGTLDGGWYQVAVSYLNADTGEEGGVSPSNNFHLSTGAGFIVDLPQPVIGATHINVFVSTLNGSVPFIQQSLPVGTEVAIITTTTTTGREANQRYEAVLPAGTRIFEFNGRLCSVKGADLFVGLPYRPGYYLPVEGRIAFSENISIAIGNQTGVYVAADKTYWLGGFDLAGEVQVRDVQPYGATPGTEFVLPLDEVVGWFCEGGIVLAEKDGQMATPMFDRIDLTPPQAGVSTVLSSNGIVRVVSCGWCMNIKNKAATTYSGYDFNSYSGDYALSQTGLHRIDGGDLVNASVNFGKQDFGSENLKYMPAVYLGAASTAPLAVGVTTYGDTHEYFARSHSETVTVHRVDPAKGLEANWYELTVRNSDGGDFSLASISFATNKSSRRI